MTQEASPSQITLSWTDNAFNETGFRIERSVGDNQNFTELITVGTNVSGYTDNFVSSDNGYYYRIVATNATGDAVQSNEKFASSLIEPGNAIQFDGVDDYFNINALSSVMAGKENQMTVEFWLNANNIYTGANWASFFSVNDASGG